MLDIEKETATRIIDALAVAIDGGDKALAAHFPLPDCATNMVQTGKERSMDERHIYKVVELVGSSGESIDDAIRVAIARAGKTLRNLRWFEVTQTRGHVENGEVRHFQVTLKAGFMLDDGEGG